MGNGMNKVFPGLYVGNFHDCKDQEQLIANNITHIVAIHDNAKPQHKDKEYLCLVASDTAGQDLTQFFARSNSFIHGARIGGGNVLVHCLAGVSRSVTLSVAYVMAVTDLRWRDALHVVRMSRSCANPNMGFQKQLGEYEVLQLNEERTRLQTKFAASPFVADEQQLVQQKLKEWTRFVRYGDEVGTDEYPLPAGAYKSASSKESGGAATSSGGSQTPAASSGGSQAFEASSGGSQAPEASSGGSQAPITSSGGSLAPLASSEEFEDPAALSRHDQPSGACEPVATTDCLASDFTSNTSQCSAATPSSQRIVTSHKEVTSSSESRDSDHELVDRLFNENCVRTSSQI